MEMEPGKLFVGGISWDTNEERLREYFQTFGEVVEAVIMKDRTTGRARGFGFVVFADASVAEKVVKERHVVDGRIVEAKKAVPREDHQNFNRNGGSTQGSPGLARTRKIFVGGLASTVTESDFKRYFEQFGTITDVVVMYDHNTQRPRGFGFITYDSEEAVDRVLFKTFHELNGKMVEVKRAVPKELSPGPTRSPSSIHGVNRVNSFLSPYNQGYNSSSPGGYGLRMEGQFSPASMVRSGYSPYGPSNYSKGTNLDSLLSINYGMGNDSGLGYGRGMNSYFSGNTNRYGNPMSYNVGAAGNGNLLNINTTNQNLWGGSSLNYGVSSVSSNGFVGSRTANTAPSDDLGRIGGIWGSSSQGSDNGSLNARILGYSNREYSVGGRTDYRRNNESAAATLYSGTQDARDAGLGNLFGDNSFYSNHPWGSSSPDIEGAESFGFQPNAPSDVMHDDTVGYVGGYGVNTRSNRGIAA